MNHRLRVTLSFFLFVFCSIGNFKCLGEVRIAVINLKKVISNCEAGKDIEKQLDNMNETEKSVLLDLENKIKKMNSDTSSGLKNNENVESLQIQLYELVRTKKSEIAEAQQEAFDKLLKIIEGVVEAFAKEKNLTVFHSEAVFCSNCAVDITEEIIKRVNKITKNNPIRVSSK